MTSATSAPKRIIHANQNIKSCSARGQGITYLSLCMCCCCCCCRVKVSQSSEEFGTDAEQQLWWGLGFYLQVGGAARAEGEESHWISTCMWGEGGRKTGSLWEGNHLLHRHVCSIWGYHKQKQTSKGRKNRKPNQLHNCISQGGRFLFDLDLSLHSLHAERFKGMVSLWLAALAEVKNRAERRGCCDCNSPHSVVDINLTTTSIANAVQTVHIPVSQRPLKQHSLYTHYLLKLYFSHVLSSVIWALRSQ